MQTDWVRSGALSLNLMRLVHLSKFLLFKKNLLIVRSNLEDQNQLYGGNPHLILVLYMRYNILTLILTLRPYLKKNLLIVRSNLEDQNQLYDGSPHLILVLYMRYNSLTLTLRAYLIYLFHLETEN